jgi:hypothetical protein
MAAARLCYTISFLNGMDKDFLFPASGGEKEN